MGADGLERQSDDVARGGGVQVSVVGDGADTKLRVHIDATNLLPYSESKTPYVASTVMSTPGADPVTVTIKYAKTFDQPAGMAATIVRFHRLTGDSAGHSSAVEPGGADRSARCKDGQSASPRKFSKSIPRRRTGSQRRRSTRLPDS